MCSVSFLAASSFAYARDAVNEKSLNALQEETARIATTIQEQERTLAGLHSTLERLKKEEQAKERDLALRQRQLASVVQGVVRLSRTPPETVMAMPGDYAEALRTAEVLELAIDSLHKQAADLRRQLETLALLRRSVEQHQQAVQRERETLSQRMKELNPKIAERQRMQAALHAKTVSESRRIAEEMRDAANVKTLVTGLEEAREKVSKKPSRARSFSTARGRISLPVAGKIIRFYGESGEAEADSKGLLLETGEEAPVTAPYDGEVVFTGPFLDYGPMVIVRHTEDYHTLMAGLSRINCVPGQFLLEGEPIGAMGNRRDGQPRLYVELRHRGKPVDPVSWMRGVSRLARYNQ